MDVLLEEIYNQKGVELTAPVGFSTMMKDSPDEYGRICNGCGPGSSLIDIIPDKLLFLDISMVCNIHDFSQEMCSATHEEFKRWNRIFFNNMCRIISNNSIPLLKRKRRNIAKLYYEAVNTFGAHIFQDLKKSENKRMIV